MKRRTNQIKKSTFDKWFDAINMILMLALAAIMLYPMLYVLFASLSDPIEFMKHKGFLWHSQGFTFKSYISAFENPMLLKSYANTIFILVVGVLLNLVLTACGAYFLSRKDVKLQKVIAIYIIITMFFSGGMIPFYFVVRGLGLEDSLWSLILPAGVNTFNLMILRVAYAPLRKS